MRLVAALALLIPAAARGAAPDVNAKVRTGQHAATDAAVVVGIENYPFLPEVPYALRDADAFYNFLVYTRGVPPTRVSLLTNDPTATDVREALKQRAAEVGAGGTLWVYFAGHGAADPETGERLLLGVDVQPKVTSLNDTQTFSLAELHATARTSPAAHVVAVVDACYTGTGRDGKTLLEGKRFAVPAYATQNGDPKVVTWTAAGPAETSGPFEPGQHGLFTYFVVGALRGWADGEFDDRRDGVVTLAEARQFVYDAVRTVGGGEQNPAFEGTAPDEERLVAGTGLESRPDLATLVSEVRGTAPDEVEKPKTPGAPPPDDFAARLAELKRLREEREAAEARERALAAEVETQHQARVEAAAGPLRQVAQRAWAQTVPLLDAGGPEAAMAARLFVETYGSLTVDVDGEAVAVKVAEVDQARAWLARAEQQSPTPTPAPTPAPDALVDAVDPLALYVPLSSHPLWELPVDSQKRAKRLGAKVGRDSWNDELWGDAADKAIAQGDGELAVYFLLHAIEIDPQDTEWASKLDSLGVGSARPAALAERLRLDPSSDELWGDLGDALVDDEEPVAACVAWSKARELDSGDTEWPQKLDEHGCASMSGNRGGAVAEAKAALDADPNNDERIGDYADALLAAGRVDEACASYQRALDLDPTDSEWPGKLVGCLETGLVVTHAPEAASSPSGDALLSQVAARRPDVSGALDAVRADPNNDERWGDLGDALGSDALATTVYTAAMRMDPSDGEWQTKVAEHGGWDTLFAVFQDILAADPSNDERLGDYGDRLLEAGRRDDACAAYRAALRFDPSDHEWPGKVAACDGAAAAPTPSGLPQDTGNAALDLAAAQLRADPENDERWGDWADALRDAGRSGDACSAYREANQRDPGDQEWIDKLGACGVSVSSASTSAEDVDDEPIGDEADALLANGDVAAACDRYQQALDADPSDSEWPGKALSCLLQLDPTGDEAIGDLGDRLASLGRMPEACAAYREALRIDKADQEWKNRRADCRGVE